MSSKTSNSSSVKISDFGKRLKETFKNSSNQSIAEKLGVSKPALTAYMQGRIPPADKLLDISKLTRCNLHWLLTGEGSRKISLTVERPQGIIVQGSKGGIGASTTALFIAATLALKGYGVLFADDNNQAAAQMLYRQERSLKSLFLNDSESKTELAKLPPNNTVDEYNSDYFLPTYNKNLDLFFPRTWVETAPSKEKIERFRFNSTEMLKRYQFVIFDAQLSENPFYYGTNPYKLFKTEQVLQNFLLEPILRNSKVIVPVDVIQSHIDNVLYTIDYIEKQKRAYPEAGFAGIFLNEQSLVRKGLKKMYDSRLFKVEENFKHEIYKSRISFHPQLRNYNVENKKIIFSRKTKIHEEFSALVDEILQK